MEDCDDQSTTSGLWTSAADRLARGAVPVGLTKNVPSTSAGNNNVQNNQIKNINGNNNTPGNGPGNPSGQAPSISRGGAATLAQSILSAPPASASNATTSWIRYMIHRTRSKILADCLFDSEDVVKILCSSLTEEDNVFVGRIVSFSIYLRAEAFVSWINTSGCDDQESANKQSQQSVRNIFSTLRQLKIVNLIPTPSSPNPVSQQQQTTKGPIPSPTKPQTGTSVPTAPPCQIHPKFRSSYLNAALKLKAPRYFFKMSSSSSKSSSSKSPSADVLFNFAVNNFSKIISLIFNRSDLLNDSSLNIQKEIITPLVSVGSSSPISPSSSVPVSRKSNQPSRGTRVVVDVKTLSTDLLAVMELCKLIVSDVPSKRFTTVASDESRFVFTWLLSDLNVQLMTIILTFLSSLEDDVLKPSEPFSQFYVKYFQNLIIQSPEINPSDDRISSSSASATQQQSVFKDFADVTSELTSGLKDSLICFIYICEIAQSKIGQCFSMTNMPESCIRLSSILVSLGVLYSTAPLSFIQQPLSNYRTIKLFTTPLIRIFTGSPSDVWLLSKYFGTEAENNHNNNINELISDNEVDDEDEILNKKIPFTLFGSSSYVPSAVSPDVKFILEPNDVNWAEPLDPLSLQFNSSCSNYSCLKLPSTSLSSRIGTKNVSNGLIVESNFRVFAMNPTPAQIAVIRQLCAVRVATPSMWVGVITKQSVSAAMRSGLTASRVISFFTSQAHPSVKQKRQKNHLIVPDSICNQLILWEQQLRRVQMTPAVVFEFSTSQEIDIFPQIVLIANTNRWTLCHSPLPGVVNPNHPTFIQWKERLLQMVKVQNESATRGVSSSNNILMKFSWEGWTAPGAVISIKPNFRDHMTRLIRTSMNKQQSG